MNEIGCQEIEYNRIEVEYRVSDASKLLSALADNGIDFLAFKATSINGRRTLFTLFSDNAQNMVEVAGQNGFRVDGPYSAIWVKGNEEIGALAAIYERLSQANINVDGPGMAHMMDYESFSYQARRLQKGSCSVERLIVGSFPTLRTLLHGARNHLRQVVFSYINAFYSVGVLVC
jgi:hypothetical protein